MSGQETDAITVLNFTFYFIFFHLFYATNSLNGVQLLVITNDPFSSLRCTTVLSLCALTSPTRHPCQSEDTWGATCQNTASASDPENRGHGSFTCSPLCADTRPDREIYRLWVYRVPFSGFPPEYITPPSPLLPFPSLPPTPLPAFKPGETIIQQPPVSSYQWQPDGERTSNTSRLVDRAALAGSLVIVERICGFRLAS